MLYSTPGEKGDNGVPRILKVDEGGVHVRFYSNRFPAAPMKVDEATLYLAGATRKPGEAVGMGHAPVSKKGFAQERHASRKVTGSHFETMIGTDPGYAHVRAGLRP